MHYLDTSVLLAIFFPEVHTEAAHAFLTGGGDDLAVSPWVAVEIESVLNRKRRTETLDRDRDGEVRDTYHRFINDGHLTVLPLGLDVFRHAATLLRGDAPLRSADALHLAVTDLRGATLATCDRQLERAARLHGVESLLV